MLFQRWSDLGQVLATSLLVYPTLVLVLRVSGKRTLAKMNAFDLVVTVALGSTLATILLSADVSLAEGLLALVLLVGLQLAVAWVSVRSGGSGAPSRPPRRCCCTEGSCWRSGCGPSG